MIKMGHKKRAQVAWYGSDMVVRLVDGGGRMIFFFVSSEFHGEKPKLVLCSQSVIFKGYLSIMDYPKHITDFISATTSSKALTRERELVSQPKLFFSNSAWK